MQYLRALIAYVFFLVFSGFSQEFTEVLHQGWKQSFEVTNWLVQTQSPFQKIAVFENPIFGRVLVLDNIVQITEKDEFVYQEMLTHVPLLAHGNVKKVLIIGGGDGGILREVLKHTTVKKAVLVDIDGQVMEISKQYLPNISQGAFDDPRAEVLAADGIDYVKKTKELFDVIIVDTTDPIGPGEVLFSEDFFAYCKKALTANGILVIQNGVVFLQKEELQMTKKHLLPHFKHVTFYTASVPTYVGGVMAFGFATDDSRALTRPLIALKKKIDQINGSLQYYTPKIHQASFVLPLWVENYLK